MAQSISQEAIGATGLPGATAASRHAGATTSGAPTTGTFAVGDFIVDQSGAMYVCTVAGTPGTWQLSGVSVKENIAGKNVLINGGADIWQRGTSFAYAGGTTYTADRWWATMTNTGMVVSKVAGTAGTSGVVQTQNAIRQQRTSGNTNTGFIQIGQPVEIANATPFCGQTVTFSFYAKAGANMTASNVITAYLVTGTGTTDVNPLVSGYTGQVVNVLGTPTLTTSWQLFTFTTTIGASITQFTSLFSYAPTGTAGANDYFDITGVQLEIGSTATAFSRAGGTIQGELAACQRYYYQTALGFLGVGSLSNSSSADFGIRFPVTMRATPTMFSTSISSSLYVQSAAVSTSYSTAGNFYNTSVDTTTPRITVSGYTAGQACIVNSIVSGAYISASAEL